MDWGGGGWGGSGEAAEGAGLKTGAQTRRPGCVGSRLPAKHEDAVAFRAVF